MSKPRYRFYMTVIDNENNDERGNTVIEIGFNTNYPGEIQNEMFKAMTKLEEPKGG